MVVSEENVSYAQKVAVVESGSLQVRVWNVSGSEFESQLPSVGVGRRHFHGTVLHGCLRVRFPLLTHLPALC